VGFFCPSLHKKCADVALQKMQNKLFSIAESILRRFVPCRSNKQGSGDHLLFGFSDLIRAKRADLYSICIAIFCFASEK